MHLKEFSNQIENRNKIVAVFFTVYYKGTRPVYSKLMRIGFSKKFTKYAVSTQSLCLCASLNCAHNFILYNTQI
jgi:hypothetical protein